MLKLYQIEILKLILKTTDQLQWLLVVSELRYHMIITWYLKKKLFEYSIQKLIHYVCYLNIFAKKLFIVLSSKEKTDKKEKNIFYNNIHDL